MSVKKFSVLFCVAVLLVICFTLPAFSQADSSVIYDNLDLFSDEECADITESMNRLYDSGIICYTITSQKYYGNNDTFIDEYRIDISKDVIVFVISPNGSNSYHYDTYCYGKPERRISDSEIDKILDSSDVHDSIKYNKDFARGTVAFFTACTDAVKVPYGTVIIIAVVIGLVCGGIAAGIVSAKYKMKMRPTNYPLDKYAKLKLTDQKDTFIGKHVAVAVTPSNGGGKSFGGGGGFSGTSHGGSHAGR